jgi:hypothetical protein
MPESGQFGKLPGDGGVYLFAAASNSAMRSEQT